MENACRSVCGAWKGLLFIALCVVLSGCRPRTAPASSPGTIINPLQGEAATNHARQVEVIRHLPQKANWERRSFKSAKTESELKYLLFKPTVVANGTNFPLVLSLHGGSVRNDFDDLLDPYKGLPFSLGRLVSEETQRIHPCFVLAPWSNERNWDDANIEMILEALDALQREFRVDTNRLYITGQSMGGFGTWRVITRYPGRFSAAVPVCGGGIPNDAPRAKDTPIWAFHGTADKVVPATYTRDIVSALRAAGGNPRYWEYLGESHAGTAERAYCEPELIEWLFSHARR